jgi:hypothetical protein
VNTDPGEVLSSIYGSYDSVWAYDPGTGWSIYIPGGISDLEEMVVGKGYWIKMEQAGTMIVPGNVPDGTEISLIGGAWNLVGYSSMEQKKAEDCMSGVADHINSVWEYHPGTGWKIYTPGGISDLEYMKPGYGYWIKADINCIWDVNESTP